MNSRRIFRKAAFAHALGKERRAAAPRAESKTRALPRRFEPDRNGHIRPPAGKTDGNGKEGMKEMASFHGIEEARTYFQQDRFAYEAGIVLEELTEEYSVAAVELNEKHRNAYGGVMGGAIFTLADLAFAALANQIHEPTVAQQVSINYLNAPKGKKLIARAECRKDGRTSMVINVNVTDDTGRDIAQFVGTGFKMSLRA